METERLPAFSCSGGAFVAQPDDIIARERESEREGSQGKMARVTQTENRLVLATKTVATSRET